MARLEALRPEHDRFGEQQAMNVVMKTIFAIVLGMSALAAKDDGPVVVPTPQEQYTTLLKEFEKASSGGALNDDERLKFIGRVFRLRSALARKLVALAEKYPDDPIAVDALIQAVSQVNTTPWPAELVGQDPARPRAFELLQRNHLKSEKLGPLCQRLALGYCPEYETFLRSVFEKSPHKSVRGQACLSLAQFLSNRRGRLDLIKEQPELAKEFSDLFSKDYLQGLQQQDRTADAAESEAFFVQAAENFGDITVADDTTTVGEKAKSALYEMRHLSVGKIAPDIEGDDQEGVSFKLSDYRGKVVLLDFWSEY
jgi:AhpC/TSA family